MYKHDFNFADIILIDKINSWHNEISENENKILVINFYANENQKNNILETFETFGKMMGDNTQLPSGNIDLFGNRFYGFPCDIKISENIENYFKQKKIIYEIKLFFEIEKTQTQTISQQIKLLNEELKLPELISKEIAETLADKILEKVSKSNPDYFLTDSLNSFKSNEKEKKETKTTKLKRKVTFS